jgi:hypothetical protein
MRKLIPVLILALLFGCSLPPGGKPVMEMTHKERGVYFLDIYQQQYDLYQEQAKRPGLTESQVKILDAKREALEKLQPAVITYGRIVEIGAFPDPRQEKEIIDLIEIILSTIERSAQ